MDMEQEKLKTGNFRAARQRAELGGAISDSDFESWDYHILSFQAGHLYRTAIWVAGIYAAGGAGFLLLNFPDHALAFMLISFVGWACLMFWHSQGRQGMPVFPVLAAQLAFLNSLPLLTDNATLDGLTASTIRVSALTVVLFLMVLAGGWWLGVRLMQGRPSTWNITIRGGAASGGFGLNAALPLLLLGLAFQLGNISGFNYKLLPGSLAGLIPVLAAFAGAATSLGAFLGGLTVASRPFQMGTLAFWTLFAATFFLSVSGILLSGACGMVFACTIGLGFGAQRIPWKFLLATMLLVGFLNEGKGVMRSRYWDSETSVTRVQLSDLPEFYSEWADASRSAFQNGIFNNDNNTSNSDEASGGSLLKRLDNFQNLTFIVDILQRKEASPLYGATYSIIPALLIPRVLWPDKPRTHEGQIMLNLNYGRQQNIEQTYDTYIAWGLLPEAVGNFGCVGGACFLGLLAGFGCGLLEAWSARKRLLSVEGLIAAALLVELAVSYEMVASVLITSTFQLLVAVVTFGFLLRSWFMDSQLPRRRRPQQRENLIKAEIGKTDSGNQTTQAGGQWAQRAKTESLKS